MDESGFSRQLQFAFDTLGTPLGALGILGWLLLLIALLVSPKAKWVAIIGMMWCGSLSFYVEQHSVVRLVTPLEQIRAHARPLGTAFLGALLLPSLLAARGWRPRIVSAPVFLFFAFELILAMRIFMGGSHDRAAVSLFVYIILFAVMGWGLSKWVQDWKDAHNVVRTVVFAAGVYVVGTCYQLMLDPSVIVRGHRLMGTSGNAQWAALLISLTLPAACYLIARAGEPIILRVLVACLTGFMIILLLWTGSRTGLLIAGTGVLLFFWSRIGRFLAVTILVGLFVVLAMQIYDESTLSIGDMFIRGDTRTQVWREMWNAFLRQPVLGALEGEFGVGENSYLSVAGSMGFMGLIPLLAFMVMSGLALIKVFRARFVLGKEKAFADMCVAGVVALFVGAMFEGYLLGTLTIPVFLMYIYLTLSNFAVQMAERTRQEAAIDQIDPAAFGDEGFPQAAPIVDPYAAQYF